ncbi:MAG: hypothetical protein N2053_03930, partial [Chitinispirillaceae bacterium]|nr:hypothetical protein [Chitinispirillaceae bacterium]
MNKHKIFLRIIFVLTLFFLISSLVVYFILLIPTVQKKATDSICNILSQYITGTISVENLSTNVWTYLEINKVKIKDKKELSDSIYIEKVKINYRLIKLLLFKTIEVPSIEIRKIDAFFYISSDGIIKLPVLPQTLDHQKDKKEGLKLKVSRIKITKINCLFVDSALNQYAYVKDASVKGEVYSLDSIKAEIKINDGSYESKWWCGEVKKLEGSALITSRYIKILSLQVDSDKGYLNGKGVIPFKKELQWDIQLNTKIKISSFPILYKYVELIDTTGTVFLTGTLKGLLEKPYVKLNLIARELNYSSLLFDSLNISTIY